MSLVVAFTRPQAAPAQDKVVDVYAPVIVVNVASVERLLNQAILTFEAAGHNAAAPIPAPEESWARSPHLEFVPFDHYADAVWDSVRMNNIAQHFVTAFLGLHLKGDAAMADYLAPGWRGFDEGGAGGLRLETRQPGA